jgi:hypothetical protein
MIRPVLALTLALLSTALAGRPAQGELEDAVKQVATTREEYIRRFRDLMAAETWITEVLRSDGTVDQRRTVGSDFFVYQSRADSSVIREYRITREVDGKAEGDPLAQATKLFRALGKARTLKEEDAALQRQNFAHVFRFIFWGLTVDTLWPFQADRRKDFQFALAGRERDGDDDIVILKYESKTFQPRESSSVYARFKNPRSGLQGTVWLTAKDGRLRRWVEDMLVVDDEIKTPAVLIHKDLSYQSSPLGVVPTKIAIDKFDKVRGKKSAPSLRLSIRQTFAYAAFKRFDVSTATDIKKPEGNERDDHLDWDRHR